MAVRSRKTRWFPVYISRDFRFLAGLIGTWHSIYTYMIYVYIVHVFFKRDSDTIFEKETGFHSEKWWVMLGPTWKVTKFVCHDKNPPVKR